MLGSVRQRVTFVSHVLLVSMVAVAWYYVLVAGKVVREAPFNEAPPLFGHCPNSNYTPHTPAPPRPHANGHSEALFSGAIFPF